MPRSVIQLTPNMIRQATRKGNALIGQSGGPTAVINASLVGVVDGCKKVKQIGRVFGMRFGIEGVLGDFLLDRHPATDNVWLAGGGSGHGFKMGPAIGEYVARLVLDGAAPDARFTYAHFAEGRDRVCAALAQGRRGVKILRDVPRDVRPPGRLRGRHLG